MAILESEPQPELQLARLNSERGNRSRARVTDAHGIPAPYSWGVQILDVKDVEGLQAKLQIPSFVTQRDALEHREIHIKHRRTSERVFPEISKCSGGSGKSARIEPRLGDVGGVRG